MATEVPPGFTDLETAAGMEKHKDMNLMGVVVDFMPHKKTGGTDWTCSFNIGDYSSSHEGLRVRYFEGQTILPKITGTGDVVILHRIQKKYFQGSDILLSNRETTWTVFTAACIPESMPEGDFSLKYVSYIKGSKRARPPTSQEMKYAFVLCNSRDRSAFTMPPLTAFGTTSEIRDKFSLIQDIKSNTYYDLVGQAVKTYSTGDRTDIHLTDYTSNNLLFDHDSTADEQKERGRDGDEFGYATNVTRNGRSWKGPSGQRTLMVTLFNPHSDFACRKVRESNFVCLKNVYIKTDKSGVAKLEGTMHTDRKYPEKINVAVVTPDSDDRVKGVLKRKREYLKQEAQEAQNLEKDNLKRKVAGNDNRELSKAQKRKQKKQREVAKAAAAKSSNNTEVNEPDQSVDPRASFHAVCLELNKNVSCKNMVKDSRTVSSINSTTKTHTYITPGGVPCSLPYQNVYSRTTVRVVDFFPNKLEDFAVKCRMSEFDALSDAGDEDEDEGDDVSVASSGPIINGSQEEEEEVSEEDNDNRPKHRWAWRFALLLEDASSASPKTERDRLIAIVAGKDAEFLLNKTATNLRRRPKALDQLRERLFILWGELEECKSRALKDGHIAEPFHKIAAKRDGNSPKPLPFSCCLKEYGVKVTGGWERRFRLFDTNITK